MKRHLEKRHRGPADVIIAKFNNGDETPTWQPEPTIMMLTPVVVDDLPLEIKVDVKKEKDKQPVGSFAYSVAAMLSSSTGGVQLRQEDEDEVVGGGEEAANIVSLGKQVESVISSGYSFSDFCWDEKEEVPSYSYEPRVKREKSAEAVVFN